VGGLFFWLIVSKTISHYFSERLSVFRAFERPVSIRGREIRATMSGYSSTIGKSYGSINFPQNTQQQPQDEEEEEDEGEEAVGEDEPLFLAPLSTVQYQVPSGLVAAAWQTLVFGWFTPVVEGMKRQIELGQSPNLEEDEGIPPLPPNDRTLLVSKYFEELWKQENLRVESDHGGVATAAAAAAAAAAGSPIFSTTSSVIDETSDDESIPRPNLVFCLWKLISPTFVRAGILKLLHDCLQFVGPQVLNRFILFLRDPDESAWTGVYLTLAVTVAQLIMSLALRHYFFACYRVGIRIRAALLLTIYRKSLTIDSTYYTTHPVGQITNLMSVDVQRIQDAVPFLHAIWYSVVQVALALYFLWQQLGPSCLAGVAVICVSIPITAMLGGWMGSLAKELMERKDDRIQVNQELLTNMKVVKLQAWESSFLEKVQHLRSRELRQLFRYNVGSSCVWLMWSAIPLLIALGTFGAYVTIAGHALDVASALTALALFEIMRFPLFMFPRVVNSIVEGKVSLTRIIDFLSAPDRVPPRRLKDTSPHMVDMMNATFSYDSPPLVEGTTLGTTKLRSSFRGVAAGSGRQQRTSLGTQSADGDGEAEALLAIKDDSSLLDDVPFETVKRVNINVDALVRSTAQEGDTYHRHSVALRRIDLRCDEGEFIAVVGGVGSGKSTLLKAVLGEVQRLSGDIAVRGKVAYFDQSPFIMNDTIKGNILFGKSDDNIDLYNLAVKSCSLQHDLNMLPNGDQCEIGERGITLSGGQKARVAMARVVYQNADIALLDDCLSAVDAHVGRALFDECILNVLLLQDKEGVQTTMNGGNGASKKKRKKRTVILVTNALQYLNHPLVDRIVVMKGGAIVETGSYKELLDREDSYFKSFWGAFSDSMAGDYRDGIETPLEAEKDPLENGILPTVNVKRNPLGLRTASRRKLIEDREGVPNEKTHELMTDEMAERAIGKVGRDVYMEWAKAAGGVWVMLPILLIFSIEQCTIVLSNWWLTYWSHAASQDSKSQEHFLAIYGMINFVAIIVGFLPMLCVLLLGLRASKKVCSVSYCRNEKLRGLKCISCVPKNVLIHGCCCCC
jgi:ATP-binding cassette, subfamily C (CFTR/MRP), member 1